MDTDYASWRPWLADANDPAFWPITAIDELLDQGAAQFWCNGEAAMVTRIVTYPGGAVAGEVIAGAGDLEQLKGTIAEAGEAWARSVGASHLLIYGRPGWQRSLPPGFRNYQSVILKEL